jgi:two-component system sensor histidine kinase TctE
MTQPPQAAVLPVAPGRGQSLRRNLLLGILVPVGLFVVLNTISTYQQALAAVNVAYDRTLLASAKSIAESLDVSGFDAQADLFATVPYSALEAFEADNQSRIYYKVSTLEGAMVSGFAGLPRWQGQIPEQPVYAALVDFYDDRFQNQAVRVAVLLQPVVSVRGRAMAVIQVAETLELREALARQVLSDTLWRQALLIAVIALVTLLVVHRATRPIRSLSDRLQARAENDLSPIVVPDLSRELRPLVHATNQVMARLGHLLDHQKRFIRDSSHQLRTPLAVLKTQVQSALQGDVEPHQALTEIRHTVERAALLADQMLALARVEQFRQQAGTPVTAWSQILREVALDLAPLIADKALDFSLTTADSPVRADEWMLAELSRNLLHNAIRHSPSGGRLRIALEHHTGQAVLCIADSGPGIGAALRLRLFQPFSSGDVRNGSGLGLAICNEIVQVLGGSLTLNNRAVDGRVEGLDAIAKLPLAPSPPLTP